MKPIRHPKLPIIDLAGPPEREPERAKGGGGGARFETPAPRPPPLVGPRKILVGIPEWVSELDLASALGLKKDGLSALRPPWAGATRKTASGAFEYSAEGVGAVLVTLGLATRTPGGIEVAADFVLVWPEKKAEVDGLTWGTAARFHLNPKKMTVQVNGQRVDLFLRDVRNFRLGMKVPLRRDDFGRWKFAGHLPRWPGRY